MVSQDGPRPELGLTSVIELLAHLKNAGVVIRCEGDSEIESSGLGREDTLLSVESLSEENIQPVLFPDNIPEGKFPVEIRTVDNDHILTIHRHNGDNAPYVLSVEDAGIQIIREIYEDEDIFIELESMSDVIGAVFFGDDQDERPQLESEINTVEELIDYLKVQGVVIRCQGEPEIEAAGLGEFDSLMRVDTLNGQAIKAILLPGQITDEQLPIKIKNFDDDDHFFTITRNYEGDERYTLYVEAAAIDTIYGISGLYMGIVADIAEQAEENIANGLDPHPNVTEKMIADAKIIEEQIFDDLLPSDSFEEDDLDEESN